jgi:hypothetical protein
VLVRLREEALLSELLERLIDLVARLRDPFEVPHGEVARLDRRARHERSQSLEEMAAYQAPPALRQLRWSGCALVVVSNWDCSLQERLEETAPT